MHLKGPINNNYSVSLPFPSFRMDCQLWSLVIIIILLLKTHSTVSNWKQNALLKQQEAKRTAREPFFWLNVRCVNFIRWLLFSVRTPFPECGFLPTQAIFLMFIPSCLNIPCKHSESLPLENLLAEPLYLSASGSLGTMFPFWWA